MFSPASPSCAKTRPMPRHPRLSIAHSAAECRRRNGRASHSVSGEGRPVRPHGRLQFNPLPTAPTARECAPSSPARPPGFPARKYAEECPCLRHRLAQQVAATGSMPLWRDRAWLLQPAPSRGGCAHQRPRLQCWRPPDRVELTHRRIWPCESGNGSILRSRSSLHAVDMPQLQFRARVRRRTGPGA